MSRKKENIDATQQQNNFSAKNSNGACPNTMVIDI